MTRITRTPPPRFEFKLMKPTPVYDFHTPLSDICSREDYLYKQSLRKSLCPTFVPDTGRYAVHASNKTVKKTPKPPIQVSELEQEIKKIHRDFKTRERLQRQHRLLEAQDKFAKLHDREIERDLESLAQKKLLHTADDRNKIAELNYLLHRKKAPTASQHAFQDADFASPERPRIKSAEKYRASASGADRTYDTTHTSPGRRRAEHTIPFAIGDSMAADDIILEAEDEQPDRDVERIEYTRLPRTQEPAPHTQSRSDLLQLIREMEEEIHCLTKDLEEARALQGHQASAAPPQLREKLRAFLVRNGWSLSQAKSASSDKERRLQQLLDLLKKHEPALAKAAGKPDSDLGFQLAEAITENDNLLAELEAASSDSPADATASQQQLAGTSLADLQDQLEASRHKLALYDEYFKRLHKFDKSLLKLTSDQLLTRGSEYSVELLLKALEQQADKLLQAEDKNRQTASELLSLKKSVSDIEALVEADKKALAKELDDIRVISNPAVIRYEALHDHKALSQLELARLIRDRVTKMKIENDDFLARLSLADQRAELRDIEIRDLKEKLNAAVQQAERAEQDKHLLEDKLAYSAIQLAAQRDSLAAAQTEELRLRLREEHRRELQALRDHLDQTVQVNRELAAQLELLKAAPTRRHSQEEPLAWALQQLAGLLLDPAAEASLDPATRKQLLEAFGQTRGPLLLDFEQTVSSAKLARRLLEESFRDRLLRSQLVLRAAASQLPPLADLLRGSDQPDQAQLAALTSLLDDLRLQLAANQRLCSAADLQDLLRSDASLQDSQSAKDSKPVDQLRSKLKTNAELLAMVRSTHQLAQTEQTAPVLADRSKKLAQADSRPDGQDLQRSHTFGQRDATPSFGTHLSQSKASDPGPSRPVHALPATMKIFDQLALSRESVEQRDPRRLVPLLPETLAQDLPTPNPARPARFAKVIGFVDEGQPVQPSPEPKPVASPAHSDSLNITEDVDMYEKIKSSPKELRDILKESSAFLQRENIKLETDSLRSKHSPNSDALEPQQPQPHSKENRDESMYHLLHQQAKVLEARLDLRRNSADA